MSAALIRECRDRGVSLRVDGGELVIKGPLDADLKQRLRQHKAELLRLLTPPTDEHGPTAPCHCGCCSWYLAPGVTDWRCRECRPAKMADGFVIMAVST